MTKIIVTESENETMLAGEELAKEILAIDKDRSIVIFLEGELGAGLSELKLLSLKASSEGLNYDKKWLQVKHLLSINLVQIHETEKF